MDLQVRAHREGTALIRKMKCPQGEEQRVPSGGGGRARLPLQPRRSLSAAVIGICATAELLQTQITDLRVPSREHAQAEGARLCHNTCH